MSDKFEFIDAEYAGNKTSKSADAPSIVQMCRWLDVKRSSFNDWRSRPASATAKRRDELKLMRDALERASLEYLRTEDAICENFRRFEAKIRDGMARGRSFHDDVPSSPPGPSLLIRS